MVFYNRLTCPKSIMFIQGATDADHPPKPRQAVTCFVAAVAT